MQDRKAVSVKVTGRVQGVSFRAWTQDEAESRGLSGWVRNERDGSVSALFAGPAERVDQMLKILWQGPPAASVSNVESAEADPAAAEGGFRITR